MPSPGDLLATVLEGNTKAMRPYIRALVSTTGPCCLVSLPVLRFLIHLKDWNNVGDRTGISILKLLRHIGVDHEVHLQWIPSHVDIYGNEIADDLAKQGTAEPLCSAPSLTFDEIYAIRKNKNLKTWWVSPSHDWYKRSSPGGSIGLTCDRAD
ncbi:hypothetical protein AVEN_63952-1 [Araneus ventricosus]|uniref:Uncharacterized protein n=1 Tax=Araneus ventricosus TaxID=182803 RepID=A0A4Y2NA03_ARAVE|nr:hypothetical protein AVEN_63952-1 [Araneus ventricosus]